MPMKRAAVILLCLLAQTGQSRAQTAAQTLIARGEYLAKVGDCAGCHTAPQGGAPFAGGLGMASPFGTIVTSNITPDKQYGIGDYTYDDFARTLREGQAPDRLRAPRPLENDDIRSRPA